jgi:hypothetical protein
VSARWPIPRPTEDAALRTVPSSPALPPVDVLFDYLIRAYATRDRAGLGRFGHQIARAGGTPPLR